MLPSVTISFSFHNSLLWENTVPALACSVFSYIVSINNNNVLSFTHLTVHLSHIVTKTHFSWRYEILVELNAKKTKVCAVSANITELSCHTEWHWSIYATGISLFYSSYSLGQGGIGPKNPHGVILYA